MLHQIGGVGNDPGDKDLTVRELNILPNLPFMLVSGVRGLNTVSPSSNAKHNVHNVFQSHIGDVGAVPASPLQVVANSVLWNPLQGVIDGLHS